LDLNDKDLLLNWYNSLTLDSQSALNWNLANNLCSQNGITCDISEPQRVTQMYPFFIFFIFFYLDLKVYDLK